MADESPVTEEVHGAVLVATMVVAVFALIVCILPGPERHSRELKL